MSWDWIKLRIDLPDEPEVIAVAERVGLDPDAVVGKLLRLWGWASRHTTDGNAPGVTHTFVDRHVQCLQFANALVSVGWLHVQNGDLPGIVFPKWDKHNSSTAKQRILCADRLAKHRVTHRVTVPSRFCNAARVTKNKSKSNTPPTPQGGDGEHGFAHFWSAYPRKQNKALAREVWGRLAPSAETLAAMLAALERQRRGEQWTRQHGRYIPGPAKWLRRRGWEDEPRPAPGDPSPAVAQDRARRADELRRQCTVEGALPPEQVRAALRNGGVR